MLAVDAVDGNDAAAGFEAHEDDALGIAAVEIDAGGRGTQHDAAGLDEHDVVRIVDDGRACDEAGITFVGPPADVLANKIIVGADGLRKAGTMPNNGAVSASIDGLSVTAYTIPAGYHSGGGKVSLTADIETALAAI
mgnify:CR=1 FL=1